MYGKQDKKKSKKPEMRDVEKNAKHNVLSALRDQAAEMMGDKLKKVTVAADSDEDLKHGLDKAKDIVGSHGMEGSPEEEASESHHEAHAEGDDIQHPGHEGSDPNHMAEAMNEHDEDQADGVGEHSFKMDQNPSAHEADNDVEGHEHEDMDEDQIDQQLSKLMEMKKRKSAKRA